MSDAEEKTTSKPPSESLSDLDKGKQRQETPEQEEDPNQSRPEGGAKRSVTVEDGSGSEESDEEKEEDATEESSKEKEGVQQGEASGSGQAQTQGWQAIFSPQHNAYYFYNSITQETTWVNPMQPQPEASGSGSASSSVQPASASPEPSGQQPEASGSGSAQGATSHYAALQAAAIAQGIDPALAHLDPSLLSSVPGRPVDGAGIPLFTAKFNRHTGAFAKADARDPSHLSEFERAKRMSEFYFDVNAWEKQLAEHGGSIRGGDEAQTGEKRKRPSKKDLERFKEQKKAKKLAKTAWLRN